MNKSFHQEFLLNCNYQSVDLNLYTENKIPTDENSLVFLISELDCKIGNIDDWNTFVEQIPNGTWIALQNDRPVSENPIYTEFSINTIKAYICRLTEAEIPCVLI